MCLFSRSFQFKWIPPEFFLGYICVSLVSWVSSFPARTSVSLSICQLYFVISCWLLPTQWSPPFHRLLICLAHMDERSLSVFTLTYIRVNEHEHTCSLKCFILRASSLICESNFFRLLHLKRDFQSQNKSFPSFALHE